MPDRPNLLALAYVENDTMKFIKYANHRARCHGDTSYKMFSVTYCEEEPDDEETSQWNVTVFSPCLLFNIIILCIVDAVYMIVVLLVIVHMAVWLASGDFKWDNRISTIFMCVTILWTSSRNCVTDMQCYGCNLCVKLLSMLVIVSFSFTHLCHMISMLTLDKD